MDQRNKRAGGGSRVHLAAAVVISALLFPRISYAAEVGCFCTFIFISLMFVVCLGLTITMKLLLSKKLLPFSWIRIVGLSFAELFLIILIFIVIQAGYVGSLALYFPLALGLNLIMVKSAERALPQPLTASRKIALAGLFALALPVSLQVSGLLFNMISGLMTFSELRV